MKSALFWLLVISHDPDANNLSASVVDQHPRATQAQCERDAAAFANLAKQRNLDPGVIYCLAVDRRHSSHLPIGLNEE